MKTLKDLGEKYYSNIHYSFDVYYYPGYDDMYVGTLKNIMEIKGYRVQNEITRRLLRRNRSRITKRKH